MFSFHIGSTNTKLMFVGEARSLHSSGVPERFFNRVGSNLIIKHYNRLERLDRDKHSRLLRTFIK